MPGLKGGFLFDDYYNLAEMSRYGDPHDWDAAEKFISQGGSALLGNMIGIGLILSMRYHHRNYRFASNDAYY